MTHSVAQSTTLTCPACRRPFPAEVWLVVDTAERPDLLARIQDGSLHAIPCPHCRHAGAVDAPLLLYRPGQTPPILFSPADQTTTEQDQEHARGLLGLLHERLGSAWQDAWLAQGLSSVPRQMLPAALSDDPEAALREVLAELAASGAEIHSAEDLERALATRPDLQAKLAAATTDRGGGFDIPPEFSSDLQQAQEAAQRYQRTNNQIALNTAAAAWERILSQPAFPTAAARFQLAAMNDIGM